MPILLKINTDFQRREIILHDLLCRLEKFTIRSVNDAEMIPGFADDVLVEAPLVGFGLVYEANDVARSIRGMSRSALTMVGADDRVKMGYCKVRPCPTRRLR